MTARLTEMVQDITARSSAAALEWEARDGALHLICPEDGQSVFKVNGGLCFNLGGAAAHLGAHLRQCHDRHAS